MRFWDWALSVYARQPVAVACLHLQDVHGQNVPFLLWAAWAALEGRPVDLPRAAELVCAWDAEVGAPLRGVRRALKPSRPHIDDTARETFREQVKAAELAGEKLLMESLEATCGPVDATRDVYGALLAAARATGAPAHEAALARLADALA
ncbi:TIGR02444 family protein [Caulobacter endophyticus]|uniref:TIGR02444 family protein n=1 Tax=Caulobacter endophyticus TaxID=2172652 RepID=UPI00240EC42C|nr:TIGR02444 family protein [Caulobacter endophyticus]MDG2529324.1 TIGR02444 family protein [Caulobacter endophyticus]